MTIDDLLNYRLDLAKAQRDLARARDPVRRALLERWIGQLEELIDRKEKERRCPN